MIYVYLIADNSINDLALEKYFVKSLKPFLGLDESWLHKIQYDWEFSSDVKNSIKFFINYNKKLESLCENYGFSCEVVGNISDLDNKDTYKGVVQIALGKDNKFKTINEHYWIYIDSNGTCFATF